jgi:hypothetical protein
MAQSGGKIGRRDGLEVAFRRRSDEVVAFQSRRQFSSALHIAQARVGNIPAFHVAEWEYGFC